MTKRYQTRYIVEELQPCCSVSGCRKIASFFVFLPYGKEEIRVPVCPMHVDEKEALAVERWKEK